MQITIQGETLKGTRETAKPGSRTRFEGKLQGTNFTITANDSRGNETIINGAVKDGNIQLKFKQTNCSYESVLAKADRFFEEITKYAGDVHPRSNREGSGCGAGRAFTDSIKGDEINIVRVTSTGGARYNGKLKQNSFEISRMEGSNVAIASGRVEADSIQFTFELAKCRFNGVLKKQS